MRSNWLCLTVSWVTISEEERGIGEERFRISSQGNQYTANSQQLTMVTNAAIPENNWDITNRCTKAIILWGAMIFNDVCTSSGSPTWLHFWEGWKPKSPSCARVSIYNTAGMRPIDEYWPPKLIQWTLATFYDHFKCTVTFSPDLELLYLEPKLLCTCSGHKRQLDKIGDIFSRWVWSTGWTCVGLKRISQTLERYRILRNTKFGLFKGRVLVHSNLV